MSIIWLKGIEDMLNLPTDCWVPLQYRYLIRIIEEFEKADKDESGYIDEEELLRMVQQVRAMLSTSSMIVNIGETHCETGSAQYA